MVLTTRSLVLLVGVIVIILAAFGVDLSEKVDEGLLGIAIAFAAFLVA